MKKRYSIYFILLLICSCETEPYDKPYIINPNIASRQLELIDILESVSFIPLEQSTKSNISLIYEAGYTDDYIMVRNWDRSSSIKAFDWTGKHAFNITTTGDGPNEIGSIYSFSVIHNNNNNNDIVIADRDNSRIVLYNLDKREVIREHRVEPPPQLVHANDKYIYTLDYDFEHGCVKIYNLDIELLNLGVTGDNKFNQFKSRKPFLTNQGQTYLSVHLSDTLYQITDSEIIPIGALGANENSIANLSFNDIMSFGDMSTGGRKLYSDENPYIMPFGNIALVESTMIIPTMNGKTLMWDLVKKEGITIKYTQVKHLNLINPHGRWESLFEPEDGIMYGSIVLTDEVYNSIALLPQEDHPVYNAYRNLAKEYPPERGFENPILIRMKMKDGLISRLQ